MQAANHRTGWSMWAMAAGVLAAAGAAAGDNAIAPTRLIAEPTFQSIGVQVLYAGDANFNAAGGVQYRPAGEERWLTAHRLLRISDRPMDPDGRGARNPRFATSIMFLKEDTEYEVRATMTDADGVAGQLEPVKVRTRGSRAPTGGGKEYHVDAAAPAGGDGSKERPFNTIEKGLSVGGPGDTIHFAKGSYRPIKHIGCRLSGSEKAWLHLKAEPGAVITDADPAVSGVGKVKWEQAGKDANGRWIYKAPLTGVNRVMIRRTPGDPATGYFLWGFGNDRRATGARGAARGQTLQHMIDDSTSMNDLGTFLQDAGALYVVPPKGFDEPGRIDFQISRAGGHGDGEVWFHGHHVVVEGFTVELTAGLRVRAPGHHFIFRRLACYGAMPGGFWPGTHSLTEDCRFVFNAHWGWINSPPAKNGTRAWGKIKNGFNDTTMLRPASDSTARYNLIFGHSNALPYATEGGISNMDIHNNVFRFTGDDCVEPDGPFVNGRVYCNLMWDLFNGISDAPVSVGPAFIVRNVFVNYQQAAFKVRNGADGQALYYHNTCWPNTRDVRAYSDTPDGSYAYAPDGDGVRWMTTRNNILIARREPYVIASRLPKPKRASLDFDFNVLWALDTKSKGRTVGETHSIYALPKFTDLVAPDLRLADDRQPGIDAGQVIKGINDEVPAPFQYAGKAPDIGAYESGAELPHYGPR